LSGERPRGRALRQRVLELLRAEDFAGSLRRLEEHPPGRTVPVLLGLLCSADPAVRHRAAAAVGAETARLAGDDAEAARQMVRRLLWSLNDESGGIGWGAPEALAEILARHEGLAREYAAMLVSYARPDGNYLEHVPLQRDLLRGMARLAAVRPRLLLERGAERLLGPYLNSADPEVRGLAARCAGRLRAQGAREAVRSLREDRAEILLFEAGAPRTVRVGELASQALEEMDAHGPAARLA